MGKQKGPKLTKEELKERRREKRLLAKQRREEKYRQVKRDQLSRELKYCTLNREKYEKGWKQTLFDYKMRDLHIQYQYHVSCSERILDAKDMQISLLLDELDIAEEQYEFNLKKHVANFDIIIDALDQSLNHIKDQYDAELKELIELAEAERVELKTKAKENELNLKLVIFGLERKRYVSSNEMKASYLSRIKEEEDMSMAEIELKQTALEHRFESLWRAYKETINEYRRENDGTKKEYEVLYAQDSFMRKWVKEQTRQLFKAYDKIYQLKFEQSQEKDSIDLQLKSKMDEHQFFLNGFHSLKKQLKEDVTKDDEQSKYVVQYCNESIKKIESVRKKGQDILKINGICRKYETDKELIMPYPEYIPHESAIHISSKADQVKLYKEKKILDLFLQRCSQGDALRNALYEELQYYTKENKMLKKQIINHCRSPEYSCSNVKKQKDEKNVKFICVKNFTAIDN